MSNKLLFLLVFSFFVFQVSAQKDSLTVGTEQFPQNENSVNSKPYNALAPAKAAFFSAVLPGLGQAYNGSYWKIPLVYAGIGGGIYFYIQNNDQYHRYRDAYKRRLAGYEDEFHDLLNNDALIEAQKYYQRQKELSLLVTIGFYILNIIDANVEAHLQQFNVGEDLSIKTKIDQNNITGKNDFGLSLNFKF